VIVSLGRDQEGLMMKFPIELDPKQATLNKNIVDRKSSKVHAVSFSRVQGNIFPLHDAINFEDKRKKDDVNLKLGSMNVGFIKVLYWNPNFNIN
jgi:hypothetical protein